MEENLLDIRNEDNNIIINNHNDNNITPGNDNNITPGNEDNLINENNKNMIKSTLISMGYEDSLITTIFNNINPVDIEEVLYYLNKNEQGFFTHSYIPNERFVCSICEKGRGIHINEGVFLEQENNEDINNNILFNDSTPNNELSFEHNNEENLNLNNNLNPRRSRLESSYNIVKLKINNIQNKVCGICEEKINENDINKIIIKCNHIFCKDCWITYLEEKINNANVKMVVELF